MQTPPQIKQTIAANIAGCREEMGLSRRAFAELIGVDQMLVYKWERGKHRPSYENFASLSEATDHPVAWFYSDHSDERSAA